ncbi:MAG TPA: hypothetical protein VEI97_11275 [bacterium]|nr:hypothetical protein [bacterium]
MTVEETPLDTVWLKHYGGVVIVGYSVSARQYYRRSLKYGRTPLQADDALAVDHLHTETPRLLDQERASGIWVRISRPRPLVWVEIGELPT